MAQSGAHGNMDISDQKATFHGFMMATVWGCGLIAQSVGLLTLAFAIGAGWWAGFVVFVLGKPLLQGKGEAPEPKKLKENVAGPLNREHVIYLSSLLGVLAQRLVRKLCPHCKRQDGHGKWHPVGCSECGMSGYKGRTGVYELMVADDDIRTLIHEQASEAKLFERAQLGGMKTMRDDGDRLVAEGVTSLEEVLRVTRE